MQESHNNLKIPKDKLYSVSFKERVYEVVRSIPKGSVLSYKEVAERAGSPRAYRIVGTLMKKNYDPSIPCHRVIKSNGEAGEYNRGGRDLKKRLLMQEGVTNRYIVHE